MSLLSGTDLALLLQQPESERFERKSELDPGQVEQSLTLVHVITCMANTAGGVILIGTKGRQISKSQQQHFDSAQVDDKVNTFVEPHISGIAVSVLQDEFVVLSVEKSHNPPHVFKRDGNYQDPSGKARHTFRRGEIRVRHSSKCEPANREDLDRMFEERQRRLYEKVKMVFEAPPDAQIRISGGAEMAVRIDPDAPGAQPIYDLLTPDPFRDIQQELTGALKAWKTSGQLLNDRQITKAYQHRESITDPQILELILRSCWERYLPGFYFASKVESVSLLQILQSTLSANLYPAVNCALKVAALLPRDVARPLVRIGQESGRKSVLAECKKLEAVIRGRTDKSALLAAHMGAGKKISYISGMGVKEVPVEAIDLPVFEEILETLAQNKKENRSAFKLAELRWDEKAGLQRDAIRSQ